MALLALSVDVGYMQNTAAEMDRAVDAGALAGAGLLPHGTDEAEAAAREFTILNRVGSTPLTDTEVDVDMGVWDKQTHNFALGGTTPSAIRVRATRANARPLFFARALGQNHFSVSSEAIAVFQPRDIMLVLDYSGSMNDDSELKSISNLGREYIEGGLLQIYEELGSPVYGTLEFTPKWITVTGTTPPNSYRPQIDVEYRYSEVYITSTKPIDRIMIYKGGSSKTYNSPGTWNAGLGVYEATVDYGTSQITKVLVRSGHNGAPMTTANLYEETFLFDTTTRIRTHMKNCFGLNGVAYPYPAGGWDEYIDYCRSSSGANKNAGYRYQFGYMNLVNYWLETREAAHETPDLWMVSEQPITAVKNSVSLFLSFLQEVDTDDQLGLAVYNSSTGQGELERQLGQAFDEVEQISRERQAGHYEAYTNIGAGLKTAREEMQASARPGAFKMIVLMTDGVANRPTSDPMGYVMDQVALCQDLGYPVVTISLGAGADVALMQQIADMTGGFHFNIPGGQTVAEYEQDLKDAFREIVDIRPLALVK